MPAYNVANYLELAIQSVLNQTYSHWELLLVDDASQDDTLKIALEWEAKDSRIKVLQLSANQGVTNARNRALDSASGKYIAFLDSDDLWQPHKLEKQINFLESSDCDICYSWYRRMDEKGRPLRLVRAPARVSYTKLLHSNHIGNLTGIYNADELGKQYFTDFKHEDYVAWLELVKRAGEACSINEELASYRVYAGSTSSNKLRTIGWQWRIYRNSQSLGLLQSACLMLSYAINAVLKRFR